MNLALRTELVAMRDADQAAMTDFLRDADLYLDQFRSSQRVPLDTPWPYALLEWSPTHQAPEVVRTVVDVVRRNAVRLREIVAEHGWPGRTLVGMDGADSAWLILQHAGSGVRTIGTATNQAFRQSCIPLLERAVASGEAHPRHLAWTIDGIQALRGQPPIFAVLTGDYRIVDGQPVFRCPVDQNRVDQQRARIGLPPLAEDIARRRRGETVSPTGPDWADPWP